MFTYKTFTVLVMSNGNRYDIMEGYAILKSCKTAGAAKGWITTYLRKLATDPSFEPPKARKF